VTDKVVDASALAAVVYQEAEEQDIVARLHGYRSCAPALLRFEMANICIKKANRHPALRSLIIAQHARSLSFPVVEFDVDQEEVVSLAGTFKLTAYDASYLWLARRLDIELVTLDGDLMKAIAAAKP
jgi:predicted nucleic acid-binding protein